MMAERLQAAAAHLTPPFAVVDLDALDDNATSMIIRAGGLPIRLATKSIRCRAITNRVLGRSEFQGVLAYSLSEAIWLARSGIPDVLLAYPRWTGLGLPTLLRMINCASRSWSWWTRQHTASPRSCRPKNQGLHGHRRVPSSSITTVTRAERERQGPR